MTFIQAIITRIRVSLWFATVNKYRGWKAKRKLAAYTKTLSPERQAWANDLRQRLQAANSSEASQILQRTASDLTVQHARLAERIDRLAK